MKITFITLFTAILCNMIVAQEIDTLVIDSKYFEEARTVYVHKPMFYTYQSEKVKLPVIYLLDAQHDWFVQPTLNTIKYLQFTHEIPQALIVEIPLEGRIKECAIKSVYGSGLPLHHFIIDELSEKTKEYNTNDFNLIIGHSFSASFALYSLLHEPNFYSAVISHSPLNKLDSLIVGLTIKDLPLNNIFLSVGGEHHSKDKHHRANYNTLKTKHPLFFNSIHTFEANSSAHNAVPIIANPIFLTILFEKFSYRFSDIATVDVNYKLIDKPHSVVQEINNIQSSLQLFNAEFQLEIPDINGIASRYINSGYYDHAIAIYKKGIELYPMYYEFHWFLGELYLETKDYAKAKTHLKKSKSLILKYENQLQEKEEYFKEIDQLIEQVPAHDQQH